MRAAQTTLRRPALLLPRRAERPRRECAETAHSGAVWLFGTMFLAGYLPGIWLGRGGVSALGQQLAAYYTKSPENAAFAAIFGTEFSVSFLQLTAVFLCGFCVLGVGLLALLFAARGVFLGYCAASVAAVNGAAGLVQYRLATIVSDAATLFFACGWRVGRHVWQGNCLMLYAAAPRGKRLARCGGWPCGSARRWCCQLFSVPSGLSSPSSLPRSGADGCSSNVLSASGEEATAWRSWSRLMWV